MSPDPKNSNEQEILDPKKNNAQRKNREKSEEDDIPLEVSRTMQGFLQMSSRPRNGLSILFEKMNDKHIDKYLDYVQRDDDKENDRKSSDRWFQLGYILIGIVSFFILVVYLQAKDKDLLMQLIAILVAFGGGFGFGTQFKK